MAQIQGAESSQIAVVELAGKALRTTPVPRGAGHVISAMTGTMAAALVINSPVFGMRLDPSSSVRAFIDRICLDWTTIAAFGVPVTAGRRLALFRGAGAALSGGTAIADTAKKHSLASSSQFKATEGGDIRIATTGALTDAGVNWEAEPLAVLSLTHLGAAGAFQQFVLDFAADKHEVVLEPGQVLGIRNPVAMDAGGTWQLGVNIQAREAALLTATS